MKKLSRYENMCVDRISDQRGTCKDIAINDLCIFYKNNGCRLPEKLRPTDCLTYPFYPKLKEKNGELEIDHFVIDSECPFHKELAKNKVILKEVKAIWKSAGKKVTNQEVGDWLGKDGNWEDWYKNTMDIKDE
jgi:Fe-S-cluster containining protein